MKKYHEALYDYIKTGGQGLVVTVDERVFRFRLPLHEDVINSEDYAYADVRKSCHILSSCLQSVGGFEVSDNHRYDLLNYFMDTPKFTSRVIGFFWACVKESHSYSSFFEAFCYTQISKNLWEEWKHSAKFNIRFSAQKYPLTDLQKSWVSFNELEDRKSEIESQWGQAFFIGSSMNPKGVQKVQREWDQKRKQQEDYRQRVVDEANEGKGVTEANRDELQSVKSVEQLQQEYWNWIEGKEDKHDQAVREYKEAVQRSVEERKNLIYKQQQDAILMGKQLQELNSLSMSSPIRAYTDQEVAQMTQGREKNTVMFEEGFEYADHLAKKYLHSPKKPGTSIPTLQDQVQGRQTPKFER